MFNFTYFVNIFLKKYISSLGCCSKITKDYIRGLTFYLVRFFLFKLLSGNSNFIKLVNLSIMNMLLFYIQSTYIFN